MLIDLNELIIAPEGKPLSDRTAAMILSDQLLMHASSQEAEIFKFFDWGYALAKKGAIEIDAGDLRVLKDFIVAQGKLSVIVKGFLLKKLKE